MPEHSDFLALRDRVILITGASSGIGRATAVAAAQQGARIVCIARRSAELSAVVDGLQGHGHLAVPFDVTEHSEIPALMKQIVERVGPLDGLVHAAGIQQTAPLRAVSDVRVAELFDINVTSALMMVKAFRHSKVRGGEPSVVLMSSIYGLLGGPGVSAYAASKAAVASLSRSLGLELAREGIRVNSIGAGVVDTPLTEAAHAAVGDQAWSTIEGSHPLGIGSPEDVANAVLFLLSTASRWVTGTVLVVDGGYTAG